MGELQPVGPVYLGLRAEFLTDRPDGKVGAFHLILWRVMGGAPMTQMACHQMVWDAAKESQKTERVASQFQEVTYEEAVRDVEAGIWDSRLLRHWNLDGSRCQTDDEPTSTGVTHNLLGRMFRVPDGSYRFAASKWNGTAWERWSEIAIPDEMKQQILESIHNG